MKIENPGRTVGTFVLWNVYAVFPLELQVRGKVLPAVFIVPRFFARLPALVPFFLPIRRNKSFANPLTLFLYRGKLLAQ